MKKYVKFTIGLFDGLIILCALSLYFLGNTEATTRLLIQWTAKISMVIFALTFGASATNYFFKDKLSAFIFKQRAYFGLTFGVFHLVHLLSIFWLQFYFHPVFQIADGISLFGGSMAYLFIVAMMITTFEQVRSAMSAKLWKGLHLVGGYWIWFIFFNSYLGRVLEEGYGYFHFSLLVMVMLLRLGYLLVQRRKKTKSSS